MRTYRKNKERSTSFIVSEKAELLDFVFKKMGGKSISSLKRLLTKGQITVNGTVTTQYNHPLAPKDKVTINFVKASAGLNNSRISVLYEDDYIIAVNKAAGLLSVATDKNEDNTAFRIVMNHLKQLDRNNKLYIVHRLDRETSGVLLFAKQKETQDILQRNWQRIVEKKIYIALVEGFVEQEDGTIHSWLTEEPKSKKVYSFDYDNGGQESFTDYHVVKRFPKNTLLEVNLRTGRKNQIRVHLQSIGHPIVGDKKYGGSLSPIGRIGLHAEKIVLHHPITHQTLTIEAPIPEKISSFK